MAGGFEDRKKLLRWWLLEEAYADLLLGLNGSLQIDL